MDDVREANRRAGLHFFDSDTMIFFSSLVESGLLPGYRFITSEKRCWDDYTRVYTVRQFDPGTGRVRTVGEFGQHETLEAALEAAKIH